MQFEVDPRPVAGGVHRRALLAALGTVGAMAVIVALAVGSGAPARGDRASRSAPPGEPDGSLAGVPLTPRAAIAITTGSLPGADAIDCHDLRSEACAAVSLASVSELPPGTRGVVAIDAWSGIMCADDFDCPRPRLAGNRPLGSAVVTIDTGAQAWVNVLEAGLVSGPAAVASRTIAWIIRWVP
jgi:hypothetical protein